jgi:cytoskeletal protein CcmA (bactofilin family)
MNISPGVGHSIHIKGEVTASEALVVAGHIEGAIEVNGHPLTVAEGASVTATLQADTVIIHGQVKGEISAANKIVIRETASVDGELSAPIVYVADGAVLHGRVETTHRKAKLSIAS